MLLPWEQGDPQEEPGDMSGNNEQGVEFFRVPELKNLETSLLFCDIFVGFHKAIAFLWCFR